MFRHELAVYFDILMRYFLPLSCVIRLKHLELNCNTVTAGRIRVLHGQVSLTAVNQMCVIGVASYRPCRPRPTLFAIKPKKIKMPKCNKIEGGGGG